MLGLFSHTKFVIYSARVPLRPFFSVTMAAKDAMSPGKNTTEI